MISKIVPDGRFLLFVEFGRGVTAELLVADQKKNKLINKNLHASVKSIKTVFSMSYSSI